MILPPQRAAVSREDHDPSPAFDRPSSHGRPYGAAIFFLGRSPLGKGSSAGSRNSVPSSGAFNPDESEIAMPVFLYAQPYNPDAEGFSFRTLSEYREMEASCIDRFGQKVEEFEIQFLEGEGIDAALASAVGVNQANLPFFFEGLDNWDDYEKRILIIGLSEGCLLYTSPSPRD